MPKALPLRKLIGPSFILLGLGLGSGEVILWPFLASNYGMGKTVCEVCGHPVVRNRRGHPRIMHDKCRKLNQLFSWIEDLLCDGEFTPAASKKIRSRLWYLANKMNKPA